MSWRKPLSVGLYVLAEALLCFLKMEQVRISILNWTQFPVAFSPRLPLILQIAF